MVNLDTGLPTFSEAYNFQRLPIVGARHDGPEDVVKPSRCAPATIEFTSS